MKISGLALIAVACISLSAIGDDHDTDWPGFRGPGARGTMAGYDCPESWDATDATDKRIKWRTEVPGLGHSSPVIFGDKLFLTTAVSAQEDVPLQIGRGGNIAAADDSGEQTWWVLCYDKSTGDELWRKKACAGKPKATRHTKATHANASVAADEKHIVAFFGSEGCYCYDHDGNLLWEKDLGVVDISKYGIGWGYASSPSIYSDRVVLVCDDPKNPYLIALRLSDGEEIWRRGREGISERSWATALVHGSGSNMQVVVNGWPWIVSYDFATGDERWRIEGGGDNPTPSPFAIGETIYITNSHGGKSPIYAIESSATGNLSDTENDGSKSVLWQVERGGSYMATPVVWDDYLYLGNTNGVVRCFHATTGEKIYEQRLGGGASVTASLVAADEKIYCPSEDGFIYVIKPGPKFEILAKNNMGEPCFATPALSAGVLYVRTTKTLFAIQ
ncbi:MAG: PQQ-binding-like beta-propeller repeat protein [Aureliella sp.]